jgi:small-conductance mechanosensitive channel
MVDGHACPGRDAWAASRGHDLSTSSFWTYARRTVALGGVRALVPALLVSGLGIALIVAASFGASVIATTATGTTSRAGLIILLSVILSQVIGAVQGRKAPRRAVIAACLRVESTPHGVQITEIEVRSREGSALAALLLTHGFVYVETTYYRGEDLATLSAYFDRERGHGHQLAAQALGTSWHRLGTIYEL